MFKIFQKGLIVYSRYIPLFQKNISEYNENARFKFETRSRFNTIVQLWCGTRPMDASYPQKGV